MAKKRARGAGEGSIFERKDGRWCAIITVGYENGKRKRKAFYGQARADVVAQLTSALSTQQQGGVVPTGRQTVVEFLDRWLADCIKPHLRPRTYQSYEESCRLHIAPAIGHVGLRKLTGQQVQAFLNQLASKDSASVKGQKLGARTVAYTRVILKAALKQAVLWRLIPFNPAGEGIKIAKVERRKVEPVEIEHARTILDAVAGSRLTALFTVMLFVGLRRGEALGLSWADVDIDRRTLMVRQTLQRIAGELVLGEPKTGQSRRTIALPQAAVAALREHRTRQLEDRMRLGQAWTDTGLVFTTELGMPIDPRTVNRAFTALLESAGLPHMRVHDLRHACATLMLAQGEALKTISDVLGHSSVTVTGDIYAHVTDQLKRSVADRLDQALGVK